MPENKVVSLDERAKNEHSVPGAVAAIANEVIEYIQFHKDRREENGQRLVNHFSTLDLLDAQPVQTHQPQPRLEQVFPAD